MQVKVIASFGAYWEGKDYSPVPGRVVELPDGLAEDLLNAGHVEAVEPEKPATSAKAEDASKA